MPKKKQVTFQSHIPGKFIPRDDPPSATVSRSGTHDNRFNSRMAELLASSSTSTASATPNSNDRDPTENETSTDTASNDSSRIPPKQLQRRIVTMLETLRRRGGNSTGAVSPPTSPKLTSNHLETKSQPITFGQLRKATNASLPSPIVEKQQQSISSAPVATARSYIDLSTTDLNTMVNETRPTVKQHHANKERIYVSPSLEQLHVVPRMTEDEQQIPSIQEEFTPTVPLTVDEILASYYSKVQGPPPPPPPPPVYSNPNVNYFMQQSIPTTGWSSAPPPPLLLNDQNRYRPPPPSYSSILASNVHRPLPSTSNLVRPPVSSAVLEQFYPPPSANTSTIPLVPPATIAAPVRPPPPRYETPVDVVPKPPGFDREFSRLLYGKEGGKTRHQRQKRKAFSDPVKKSVEEAGRSVEKANRRLTTHLNRTDTVKEEEETGSDSYEIERQHLNSLLPRRFHRPSNRNATRNAIVPANPVLKKAIPPFLRVYSQAPSSNDILLQWHLFSLSELESFEAMMTKLYKDENLTRVQAYENYRAALVSMLTTKKSKIKADLDDEDSITTTAL